MAAPTNGSYRRFYLPFKPKWRRAIKLLPTILVLLIPLTVFPAAAGQAAITDYDRRAALTLANSAR